MTDFPFLNDVVRTKPAPELSTKAVKPAEGAKTELESRLLNALRRQRFASPGALAAFVKQDDGDVRDALNDLIARKLVKWQDESLGTAGSGYVATDFAKVEPASSDGKARAQEVRSWIDSLEAN